VDARLARVEEISSFERLAAVCCGRARVAGPFSSAVAMAIREERSRGDSAATPGRVPILRLAEEQPDQERRSGADILEHGSPGHPQRAAHGIAPVLGPETRGGNSTEPSRAGGLGQVVEVGEGPCGVVMCEPGNGPVPRATYSSQAAQRVRLALARSERAGNHSPTPLRPLQHQIPQGGSADSPHPPPSFAGGHAGRPGHSPDSLT